MFGQYQRSVGFWTPCLLIYIDYLDLFESVFDHKLFSILNMTGGGAKRKGTLKLELSGMYIRTSELLEAGG